MTGNVKLPSGVENGYFDFYMTGGDILGSNPLQGEKIFSVQPVSQTIKFFVSLNLCDGQWCTPVQFDGTNIPDSCKVDISKISALTINGQLEKSGDTYTIQNLDCSSKPRIGNP